MLIAYSQDGRSLHAPRRGYPSERLISEVSGVRQLERTMSGPLIEAVDAYLEAPTDGNLNKLFLAANDYREVWIASQIPGKGLSATPNNQKSTTTYARKLEVSRVVDGIPVKLALQERTSTGVDNSWWTLSWRSKYSPDGSNRRFYMTNDGCWTIPANLALEMINEMESLGGLSEVYFDHRRRPFFETLVSTTMSATERADLLCRITGPAEDWGGDPFFMMTRDPNGHWNKVLIINSDNDTATFRSITTNPDYKPKKVLRPDADWWLDNSMMDANVQQMRAFHFQLRKYLSND